MPPYNSIQWRNRAAEARRIADLLPEEARPDMLKCADSYDKLAELAEQREITDKKPPSSS